MARSGLGSSNRTRPPSPGTTMGAPVQGVSPPVRRASEDARHRRRRPRRLNVFVLTAYFGRVEAKEPNTLKAAITRRADEVFAYLRSASGSVLCNALLAAGHKCVCLGLVELKQVGVQFALRDHRGTGYTVHDFADGVIEAPASTHDGATGAAAAPCAAARPSRRRRPATEAGRTTWPDGRDSYSENGFPCSLTPRILTWPEPGTRARHVASGDP
jgi:hypothetical protein